MKKPINKINLSVRNGKGKVITNGSVANIMIELNKVKETGGGTDIYIAYCKTDSPDSDEIQCYLNVDETGEEVTVKCLIINGSSLKYAAPFLHDGDKILVGIVSIDGESTLVCTNIEFNGARFA